MNGHKVIRLLPWTMAIVLIIGWGSDRVLSDRVEAATEKPVMVLDQDAAAEKGWAGYELDELIKRREASGRPYLPFLNVPTLRMGLYTLKAEATDNQQPHGQDETYYIVKGQGMFKAGDESWPVKAGSVIYVKRDIDHKFYDITEALDILVFFSAAE